MFLHGCITSREKSSSTPWTKLGRVSGSTAQPLVRVFLKSFVPSRWKKFSTPWNELGRVWGSTTIRSFERCWKYAQLQNQTILQRREMSWAVTGDVGERGPAINLSVFTWLHNIQRKKFINTVYKTGPCLGEHNPAISSIVFEKLHFIQTKKFLNTVKCPGPCLGEHERPFIWTLLNVCITSKRNDSSAPRIKLGRDRKNEPWQKKLGSAT